MFCAEEEIVEADVGVGADVEVEVAGV